MASNGAIKGALTFAESGTGETALTELHMATQRQSYEIPVLIFDTVELGIRGSNMGESNWSLAISPFFLAARYSFYYRDLFFFAELTSLSSHTRSASGKSLWPLVVELSPCHDPVSTNVPSVVNIST